MKDTSPKPDAISLAGELTSNCAIKPDWAPADLFTAGFSVGVQLVNKVPAGSKTGLDFKGISNGLEVCTTPFPLISCGQQIVVGYEKRVMMSAVH